MCDSMGFDCLGFLRPVTVHMEVLASCHVIRRSLFRPYGIQYSHMTKWTGGRMWIKTGAEPNFLYRPSTLHYPLYFDYNGSRSDIKPGRVGQYWIGTMENHPTDNISTWGMTQGDGPTGTMSSAPFVIAGRSMGFLIGGGCDIRKIFVDLLINGVSVLKASGQCEEEMRRVTWDLRPWQGKVATLRVADLSSRSPWGHINFDDVVFSWKVEGETDSSSSNPASRPQSGAVYVFRRHKAAEFKAPCGCVCAQDVPDFFKENFKMRYYESFEEHCTCTNNKWDCEWTQEIKLQASDKQIMSGFGRSVAVDQRAKVIAVGADEVLTTNANGASLYGNQPRHTGAVYLYTQATEFREATGHQVGGSCVCLEWRFVSIIISVRLTQ